MRQNDANTANAQMMTVLHCTHSTLPSANYRDPGIFARELESIWYREWFCAGRESDWPQTGDYRVVPIGDQRIVVPDTSGRWRAFHNDRCAAPIPRFPAQFDPGAYSLYRVSLDCWGGFVFINLAAEPALALPQALGEDAVALLRANSSRCWWLIVKHTGEREREGGGENSLGDTHGDANCDKLVRCRDGGGAR